MHILFIALQNEPATAAAPGAGGQREGMAGGTARPEPLALARLEAAQALAMALALRDDGEVSPLVVCRRGSWLSAEATARGVPVLAVSGPGDVAAHVRLWRWQRAHAPLLIQTVGAEAAGLGRRVLGMCRKGSALLSHAFPVRLPAADQRAGRAMRAAACIFCGSDLMREDVRELWAALPEKRRPGARLEVLAPGIPLAAYPPEGEPWPGTAPGRRFIFGMGESLSPGSGALAMVRAMAALWQREDLPPWEVRMFGSGPRFAEVLAEAESLGVAARLCILGDQPPDEALRQCAAWVAPGTSPDELPQTLWAGVAAGLPLICARSPLHRERLSGMPAATALRVPEKDPQALARAMIAVMRDGRLRARLREAGERARPGVGLLAMAGRYRAFCAELATRLEERAARPE